MVCSKIQAGRGAAQSRTVERCQEHIQVLQQELQCGSCQRSVRQVSSRLTPVQPSADEAPPSPQDETLQLHRRTQKNPPLSLRLGSAGLASTAKPRRFFENCGTVRRRAELIVVVKSERHEGDRTERRMALNRRRVTLTNAAD